MPTRTSTVEPEQLERLRRVRAERRDADVQATLDALEAAARRGENLLEPILDAVRVYATEGEMVASLQKVYGRYRETSVF